MQPAVPSVCADDAEAAALVQRDAGQVVGEDARRELPESASLVLGKQRLECDAPGAFAAPRPVDVDRVIGDAGVCRARAIAARAGPRDDAPGALDDDGWIAIAFVAQLRGDLIRGPRIGLERRDPILDALVIDGGDGRRVGVRGEPRRVF